MPVSMMPTVTPSPVARRWAPSGVAPISHVPLEVRERLGVPAVARPSGRAAGRRRRRPRWPSTTVRRSVATRVAQAWLGRADRVVLGGALDAGVAGDLGEEPVASGDQGEAELSLTSTTVPPAASIEASPASVPQRRPRRRTRGPGLPPAAPWRDLGRPGTCRPAMTAGDQQVNTRRPQQRQRVFALLHAPQPPCVRAPRTRTASNSPRQVVPTADQRAAQCTICAHRPRRSSAVASRSPSRASACPRAEP